MTADIDAPAADVLDVLLGSGPYRLPDDAKQPLLTQALNEAYRHHVDRCDAFRRYCERRGFRRDQTFARYEEFPFLPVYAFKDNADLLVSVPPGEVTGRLASSATSGVPSVVPIDRVTSKRQVRALASVIGDVLGAKRRPFLVADGDPVVTAPTAGARTAAVRGFLNLAREVTYTMKPEGGSALRFDPAVFRAGVEKARAANEPVVVFGFTFVLYMDVIRALIERGESVKLPAGSKVAHIGGWKKLVDQRVDRAQFAEDAHAAFGVDAADIVDFYGFTEQMGVTYPDDEEGDKICPGFADVVVRDPVTLQVLPDGTEGVLQFLTPLPHSYPGFSVLTDDLGVVTSRSVRGGRHGTRFRILGRLKKAEVRGCGDIMAEKIAPQARQAARASPGARPATSGARLLFGPDGAYVPRSVEAPVRLADLPVIESMTGLGERLREGRETLEQYSADELITLVAAAAAKWADPASPLAMLRQQGLMFLESWCRAETLRETADRSLRGARGHLDGFLPMGGTNKRLLKAESRGLVAHWLSGNVPLLGMLALSQSIICRNANLLKAASSFSTVLPLLLETFRGLEVRAHNGRTLRGDDILQSIAVVYFDREDAAATELSLTADVRLAWGGREAIEGILSLPRSVTAEDIVFGPKLSYAVIGREALSTERRARKAARAMATDISVFDQYACASPHTCFVEDGAAASARDFAVLLSEELSRAAIRIPKLPVDAATAAAVQRARLRHEFIGEVWQSSDTTWSVLFDERADARLAAPCYSRVITVRRVGDVLAAAELAHRGTQTVGTALEGPRRLAFIRRAAQRGADRFPDIGRMTYFDSPWDGLFPMERLVRWVSAGGPL